MKFWKLAAIVAMATAFGHATATNRNAATAIPSAVHPAPPPNGTPDVNEQIFAYTVLAGVLQRSVDGVRFIDGLLGILIAGQFAIYALLFDKPKVAGAMPYLDAALIIAAIAVLLTLIFVREAPKADTFARSIAVSPSRTRIDLRAIFIEVTERNEFWKNVKVWLLIASLALTVYGLLASTLENAVK